MKYLGIACLLILVGCANLREPSSIDGHPVAYDSMASGKIRARAIKKIDQQDVCFDISMVMHGVSSVEVLPGNWSLAWIDQKNQYHLLRLNQRDPASIPQKASQVPSRFGHSPEWTNTFRTCASKAELHDVKGIVLTPKDLPYDDKGTLNLNW